MKPLPASLLTALTAALATALLVPAGSTAGAAPTAPPPGARGTLSQPTTVSLPISTSSGAYTLAADGTFWTASGGGSNVWVRHHDDAGNELGDAGWSKSGGYGLIKSMAYHGGRVFVMAGDSLHSWEATTGDTARQSDSDTRFRLGGNQMILRVDATGAGRIALGQTNKVVVLDLENNAPTHPFYGQNWFGGGINSGFPANAMEGCSLPATGPPTTGEPPITCGRQFGHRDVFDYAIDTAIGAGGGVAVLSTGAGGSAPRVTIVDETRPLVVSTFGRAGSGNGEFSNPFSIVRSPDPQSLRYFISDQNNRRILEFERDGSFVAGYGIGVATGGSAFEECGPGGATCRAASGGPYYGRLDISSDGRKLYAQRGNSGVLEVFQIGAPGQQPPTPPGGGNQPPPPAPVPEQVRLKAARVKVVEGRRTKLTATVAPASRCASRRVLFQVKDGAGWDNLGTAVQVKANCTASKKSDKVQRRTQYRVVAIDPANQATTATSPTVTLKPRKPGKG